jgi:hypothetical protein
MLRRAGRATMPEASIGRLAQVSAEATPGPRHSYTMLELAPDKRQMSTFPSAWLCINMQPRPVVRRAVAGTAGSQRREARVITARRPAALRATVDDRPAVCGHPEPVVLERKPQMSGPLAAEWPDIPVPGDERSRQQWDR